jgi:hypothetical protein
VKQRASKAAKPALVVIGDTHFGSSVGLCPPTVRTGDGQTVVYSPFQRELWGYWREFWHAFVPKALEGKPYVLVHNGDLVDGNHHRTTQLVDGNVSIQQRIAEEVMAPLVANAVRYYQIAGTEAHSGSGGCLEETVAKHLGSVPDSTGRFARQELWVKMGGKVAHFAHHIATSSATAYKSSPLMRLMAQAFADAGEWGLRPPDLMVRSHCHDYTKVQRSNHTVVTCPSWQGKSGWLWSKETITNPVFGGLVITEGDWDLRVWQFVRRAKRAEEVTL